MKSSSLAYSVPGCWTALFIKCCSRMKSYLTKKVHPRTTWVAMTLKRTSRLIQRILSMKLKECRQNKVMITTRAGFYKNNVQITVNKNQISINRKENDMVAREARIQMTQTHLMMTIRGPTMMIKQMKIGINIDQPLNQMPRRFQLQTLRKRSQYHSRKKNSNLLRCLLEANLRIVSHQTIRETLSKN